MPTGIWRTIIAIALAGHGLGHVFFLIPALGIAKWGQEVHSWLLSPIAGGALTRPMGSLLWILVTAGFITAGVGVFTTHPWWRDVAITSAIVSLLAIGIFASGLPLNPTINPVLFDIAVLAALLWAHWPPAELVGS